MRVVVALEEALALLHGDASTIITTYADRIEWAALLLSMI